MAFLAKEICKTENDDIKAWTISEIHRETGYSRDTVRAAMNLYEASKGLLGLAFMVAETGDRRRSRKSQVIDWMQRMERSSSRR